MSPPGVLNKKNSDPVSPDNQAKTLWTYRWLLLLQLLSSTVIDDCFTDCYCCKLMGSCFYDWHIAWQKFEMIALLQVGRESIQKCHCKHESVPQSRQTYSVWLTSKLNAKMRGVVIKTSAFCWMGSIWTQQYVNPSIHTIGDSLFLLYHNMGTFCRPTKIFSNLICDSF